MAKNQAQKHVDQWKHNRRFAKSIDREFRDWQITAIFYTALHLVDATLASLGETVSDHTQRNEHVKTNGVFAAVRQQYLDLYRISRVTRYDADPDDWLPEKYLSVTDLADDLLKPIENGLGQIIKMGGIEFKPMELKS